MFKGTTVQNHARVSLPADSAGGGELLASARREYYFCFYFFAYPPVLGRWSASGRSERK